MALIAFSIDPVVVEEVLLCAIGTIATAVGVIALMKAAPRASSSTAEAEQGMTLLPAGRLSMTVAAQDRMSNPLNLRFTFNDPSVTLLRIELANQLDKGAATSQCVKEAPRIFVATVEPKAAQRWYNANSYWYGETKQLPIRAFYTTHEQAACRTIWVRMTPRKLPSAEFPEVGDFAWFLEGPYSGTRPALVLIPSLTRTDRPPMSTRRTIF